MPDSLQASHRAIEKIWRGEGAKIIAGVACLVRDIGLAEELAQDALVAALEHWPTDGVPANPGAWLMATGKNRALDHLRHAKMVTSKHEEIGHELEAQEALIVPDFVDSLDAARADEVGDDLLRLIFTACHPVLSTEARVALTLKLLGGLSTAEIARAFLAPEATIAQRIVRAKRALAEAQVPFELPLGDALAPRLESVLEVIYLIFNEGYTATSGDDWMRPAMTDEALRLGRLLAQLSPQKAEVQGLLALMELQASRAAARVDANGQPVLLMAQDRRTWDQLQIRRGLMALDRAKTLSGGGDANGANGAKGANDAIGARGARGAKGLEIGAGGPSAVGATVATVAQDAMGRYTLQAAIAACHARAQVAADTDWPRIVALYDLLAQVTPSPVVALNRAVAVGMAQGPQAALVIVDTLLADSRLAAYQWLPSVRADLLGKLGRHAEARAEFERAAGLTRNTQERELLLGQAKAMG